MRRALLSLLLLPLAAPPARAHFLWLLPGKVEGKPQVRMVFSDKPTPDDPALLKKVAHTEAFATGADGKTVSVKLTQEKDAFDLQLLKKPLQMVGAVCQYGVVQRGKAEPFLLTYYAKTWVGKLGEGADKFITKLTGRLDLEILPVIEATAPTAQVLWKGKPLAGAEVVVLVPGEDKPVERKLDKDGKFQLPRVQKAGLGGIRVKHVVAQEGEHKGKKYKERRYYSTLVVPLGGGLSATRIGPALADARGDKPKEDPAATKLLADARAARASWHHFPGFTADLEVNVEGRVTRGQVDVDAKGKVVLSGIDQSILSRETTRQLKSVVDHRLDEGGDLKTPCAFADDNAHHPLGRAIRVLNDEFHSSYRIRGREVIVVNRTTPVSRFTITVIENRLNAEKHYLPACYVVNYWDLKSNALMRSQAFHQEWTRVGKYDLPTGVMVVTATPDGKLAARHLKLSNHKLK